MPLLIYVTSQFDYINQMTESSKSISQDDPYPDEDLLQGLQKLASLVNSQEEGAKSKETDGSMLLDSINTYMRNSQLVIEPIQEIIEEEQEARAVSQAPPPEVPVVSEPESILLTIGDGSNQPNKTGPETHPPENQLLVQQESPVSGQKDQILGGEHSAVLLGFSQYNSKIQQSLGKTDLNSSLNVEVSNQKPIEANLEELNANINIDLGVPAASNSEGFILPQDNFIPFNGQNQVQNSIELSHFQIQLSNLNPHAQERTADFISNQSVDSSKIAALVPFDMLASEKEPNTQRNLQIEQEHEYSPRQKMNADTINEPMFIEPIPVHQEEILMEIQSYNQVNVEIPMQIEPIRLKPNEIPMEIESNNFICIQNSELNKISLDPIQQQAIQSIEQFQRAEEQEMIDSMTYRQQPAQQHFEQYKQFTFGKQQVEYSIYDRIKEEHLKEAQKSIEVDYDINNLEASKQGHVQAIVSLDEPNDESLWNQLREQNIQNISMNVQLDQNFSNRARDVEDFLDNNSRNETNATFSNNQESFLANILVQIREEQPPVSTFNTNQQNYTCIVNDMDFKTQNQPFSVPEQFEPIQERQMDQSQKQKVHFQSANVNAQVEIVHEVANLQHLVVNVQQQSVNHDLNNFSSNIQEPVQDQIEEAIIMNPPIQAMENVQENRFRRFSITNNVWSHVSNNGQFSHPKNQESFINISAINQSAQQDNHNSNNLNQNPNNPIVPPQIHNHNINQNQNQSYFYQQNQQIFNPQIAPVAVQPWMTINYRMNEASISLFGPVTQRQQEHHHIYNPIINRSEEVQSFDKQHEERVLIQPKVEPKAQKSVQIQVDQIKPIIEEHQNKPLNTVEIKSIQQKQFTEISIQTTQVEREKIQNNQIQEPVNALEKSNEIIRQSENYLISFDYCTQLFHKQFEKLISQNIILRYTPQPKSEIGAIVFKNGIFLVALVKLVTRLSPSPFIFCYMYEFLENTYGYSLERNAFIFRSECQKAKKNYQNVLQKKYNEMLMAQTKPNNDSRQEIKENKVPIKRNTITHNIFYSICGQKKHQTDFGLQIQPEKQKVPRKNDVDKQHDRREKTKQSTSDSSNHQEPTIQNNPGNKSPLSKSKKFVNPESKPESTNENKPETKPEIKAETKSIGKNENKPEVKTSIVESLVKKSTLIPKMDSFTSTQKQLASITQKQIKAINSIRDLSNKKDSNENKIKKNIEEIKNSFGSYGKKNEIQNSSGAKEQQSRVRELYEKYRKIREDGDDKGNASDIPVDNSSTKKYLIQNAKNDSEAEKKAPKKHVAFVDHLNKRDSTDNDDETDEDVLKKKKYKKKPKSKKDTSGDSSELEETAPAPVKTRRNLSKK